jgi:hypothetical protein
MIIPPTHKMVLFDVTNMYTKIPRDEAIETIRNYLLDDPTLEEHTKIPVETIMQILQMTLSMAYFVWRGTFYEQTNGLPQGSSTSGSCAQSCNHMSCHPLQCPQPHRRLGRNIAVLVSPGRRHLHLHTQGSHNPLPCMTQQHPPRHPMDI